MAPFKRAAAAMLAVLCAGCASAEGLVGSWNRSEMAVRITWLSQEDAAITCARLGAWGGDERIALLVSRQRPVGCARIDLASGVCHIFAPKPERIDDARTTVLGHELLHCFIGRYHD